MKKKMKVFDISIHLCFLRSSLSFSYKTVYLQTMARIRNNRIGKEKKSGQVSSTHGKTITRAPSQK